MSSGIQQIHDVGAKALGWLYEHREGFRLEADPSPEAGVLDRFKPLGELALIGKVIFREGVAGSQQSSLARKLLDHAWHELLDSCPEDVYKRQSTYRSGSWGTGSPSWSPRSGSITVWRAGRRWRCCRCGGWG